VAFESLGNLPNISPMGVSTVGQALGKLTAEHFNAYAAAEAQTGVPCEVLAGIHFEEADSDLSSDLQDGSSLGSRTLTESAIQAGYELQAKVNGIDSLDELINALSWYNGGGNSNCQSWDQCAGGRVHCSYYIQCDQGLVDAACRCPGTPDAGSCRITCGIGYHFRIPYTGTCPVSVGYDDPYAVNYLGSQDMYLLFQHDCTQSIPYIHPRPGAFTFAVGLYLSEKGRL
jgi:hypothetical protein